MSPLPAAVPAALNDGRSRRIALIVKAPIVAPQPVPTAEFEEPSSVMATPY